MSSRRRTRRCSRCCARSSNLTGTKHGCELGECGTCTVLVDGEPVLSCLALPVECQGREIKTVEGMAEGGRLHPLQQAFAELGAAQCGYCTPGILLTAEALLGGHPRARRATRSGTRWPGTCAGAPATPRSSTRSSWPPCACSGRAGAAAGGHGRSARHEQALLVVGQSLPKIDAWAKVIGETQVRRRHGAAADGPRQAAAQPAPARAASSASTPRAPGRCPASTRSSPGTTCRA